MGGPNPTRGLLPILILNFKTPELTMWPLDKCVTIPLREGHTPSPQGGSVIQHHELRSELDQLKGANLPVGFECVDAIVVAHS